ncbi:hypothetical protein F4805DRAFT_424777 [Annulohypoxylon moriforme]|nr:hypothetical protein F4805DRAFT_424777 [Annulohypoxylon moriforme]
MPTMSTYSGAVSSLQIQGQSYCLLLIQSSTGVLKAFYLPISNIETPKAFLMTLGQTYKAHVSSYKRLFYRCIMFQKATVSIAQIMNFSATAPVSVTSYARDTILTNALHKPSILRDTKRADFWTRYESLFVNTEQNEHPKAAILIHLEDDPVAARVFSILGSAVSLTAAVVGQFTL